MLGTCAPDSRLTDMGIKSILVVLPSRIQSVIFQNACCTITFGLILLLRGSTAPKRFCEKEIIDN